MKPPSFEYYAPSTLREALRLLRELGPDAKPLAGGQSLVPMMNFRIAQPRHLIDLNRIAELSYIRVEDGGLCIGAMARHREIEHSQIIRQHWPLLSEVMKHVAHVQIRSRGTIGGSLSHADPAAELPAAVAALDGELVLQSDSATRILRAGDFFLSALTTAAQSDELLVEIRIPKLPAGTSAAFDELSRRRGDFAIVGVAAIVKCDHAGKLVLARVTLTGVDETFVRARRAEDYLLGQEATPALIAQAARIAAANLNPPSDLHASSDYRRDVVEAVTERVLSRAVVQQGIAL
ncbi:MAG: FAD binding domain-containing protein [Bradyrhizobium sp.]